MSALSFRNQKFNYKADLNSSSIAFKGRGTDVLKKMLSNDTGIESINEIDLLCGSGKREFIQEFFSLIWFPDISVVTDRMISPAKGKIREACLDVLQVG